MRISDWSSDVCSSDLRQGREGSAGAAVGKGAGGGRAPCRPCAAGFALSLSLGQEASVACAAVPARPCAWRGSRHSARANQRSEEHTSELQSLMRILYYV